jgi:hypothetical protein
LALVFMSRHGGLMPTGNQAFTALVDPISPPSATAEILSQLAAGGGGAGVLPPGSEMPISPNSLPI